MNQSIKMPIDKIQGFIEMAVQEQLSWQTLATVLEELTVTPTIAISKQVIKILLTELETLQSKTKNNKVVSCSNCEQSTPGAQDEDTENQIQEKDEIDWTNGVVEIDQADETYGKETQAFKDSVIAEKEYSVDSKLSCPKCGEKFMFSIALKKHMKVHVDSAETIKKLVESGEKLYTFIGDSDNLDENKATQDIIVENEAQEKSQCPVTQRSQTTKNERNFSKKSFFNKELHAAEDSTQIKEKSFQCRICKKFFSSKFNLKSHQIIHSEEKPFQCKVCPKGFAFNAHLRQHEIIHSGEVPFQCKTCKKRFNKRANLNVHERIHVIKKPFYCTSCGKGFNAKQSLEQHERIHTGEKPFKCRTCSKAFRTSYELTIHNRNHSGERPYECQMCDKRFMSNSALRLHEKRPHKPSKS